MIASSFALLRLIKAGWVMAREGVFTGLDVALLPSEARFPVRIANLFAKKRKANTRADRMAKALAKLGPSYIKLGQFLATRPDLVGASIARDLESLQDRLPPFDLNIAKDKIAKAIGLPLESVFKDITPSIAAASIAQVHKAQLHKTMANFPENVAVKVLRPDVKKRFAKDLESFYLAANIAERFSAQARRLRPVAVIETLAKSVEFEMDLRLEAAAISEMAENTKEDPDFLLPQINWALTSHDVLVTSWVDGTKLSNIEALKQQGFNLVGLGDTLIQSFLRHAVRDGFFHADMHPGNLFVDHQGQIVAIDLGITGRLDVKERRYLAEILYGFIKRDYLRVAEVHFEAGYVPANQDVYAFSQALRAIGEPIHGLDASEISMGRLLTQLFEVTGLFAMRTQPQLILLQKTMVVVEGVARTLNPQLDMWKTAEPVISDWIAYKLGPAGLLSDTGRAVSSIGRLLLEAPDFVQRAERLSLAIDKRARQEDEKKSGLAHREKKPLRSKLDSLALWIGAGALVVLAAKALF
jgi:ubiquinone biosynthesis protein